MTTKQHADRVIICQWHDKDSGRYGIEAFLPDEPANVGCIACYATIGQHSEASLEYYWGTRKVDYSTPEVKALVNELISIGYNVRLMKRLARPFGGWAK